MGKTEALAEVFLTAFRSLPKADRETVLRGLVKDKNLRRDLMDLSTIEERKNEPSRPFREYALTTGVILEDYPNDPRGPSCLVNGESQGIPIHIVCGRNRSGWLVIITVYRPEPPKWESPARRRGDKR
jgi:hypothetical protein